MKKNTLLMFVGFFLMLLSINTKVLAQEKNKELGAWYMYFWGVSLPDSKFGFQGDIQHRNWNLGSDLQQLMLRAGMTYKPLDNVKTTLGYAHILGGGMDDIGLVSHEHRIYQEALVSQKLGNRVFLKHRYRFEQRWTTNRTTEAKAMRTRWRYAIFATVPLNQTDLKKGAIYLALYDEVFINGFTAIGDNELFGLFGVNRAYAALGYSIS
ncbi:MAG: DUF2490 domain-containing protein, partial [Chitinophagales bacterium]